MKTFTLFYSVLLLFSLSVITSAGSIDESIRTIRQVQPEGEGSTAAASAWKELAAADPSELPKILVGMKGADPIVSNWLATAVDVVFQKAQEDSKRLPLDQLEQFLLDATQSGQGRALVCDWLCRVDPSYRERLMPKLLGDPWSDLCQKGAQFAIEQTEALEKTDVDKAAIIASYRKTLAKTRDLEQIRDLARRLGKLGEKVDLAAQLGFIVDWQVIGPFDASGSDGFARVFPPETQKSFTFEETYEGKPALDDAEKKPRTLRWVKHHTTSTSGHVDLNEVLCKEKGVTAYVVSDFISDRDQDVELRVTAHNALHIWVNGESVGIFEFYHSGGQFDLYRAKAKFRKGKNTIVMKVRQNEQTQPWAEGWWYRFRVSTPLGAGITSTDRK